MISERKFATSYSSFWNELLPRSESFVRRLNLACRRYVDPIESPVPVEKNQRAVINELAFRLFRAKTIGSEINTRTIDALEQDVSRYVERLAPDVERIEPLAPAARDEAQEIASSLAHYFCAKDMKTVQFWPPLRGCGQINECSADIIHKKCLVEVKAGDRPFRVNDLRQVITYLALNFYSKQYELESVGLVNPRTGRSFECDVVSLIDSCAGRHPVDVFSDLVDFISLEPESK